MSGRIGKTKVRRPRLLSLCSGIGGIDLAAEMAGWEIAGQCEIDDYCQRVLARHWPDVKRVSDIRNVWGDSYDGAIDCIAAGFPCPPVSVAGKRRGADDARWLWPEVLRVIQIYEPAWTLLENVAGLISLGLDDVLADLAASGYEAWPVVFPAAAVGAPHPRERVFIVAHANCDRRGDGARESLCLARSCGTSDVGAADAADVADTAGCARRGSTWKYSGLALEGNSSTAVEHADGAGRTKSHATSITGHMGHHTRRSDQIRRDRQAQSRMGRDADGLPRRLDGAPLGYPRHPWPAWLGEPQHPWEPPRTTTERIPHRAARLKALGNAVVPQQVYPILAAIATVIQQEGA